MNLIFQCTILFCIEFNSDGFQKFDSKFYKISKNEIITPRQTGSLHKEYKCIVLTRISRGSSLCSNLRVFTSLATLEGG